MFALLEPALARARTYADSAATDFESQCVFDAAHMEA